jgi:hypothetical protein
MALGQERTLHVGVVQAVIAWSFIDLGQVQPA